MGKHRLKRLTSSKLTYVFLVAIFFGLLSVHGLRTNYSTMVKLRQEVVVTDQNNGDTEAALTKLRQHVYSHMNTNLSSDNSIKPPIQLKGRYDRLMAAEQENIKAKNAQAVNTAEAECGQRFPAGGFNPQRVDCIQVYMSQHSTSASAVADDLYKFDFISPRWSPDFAGITLALSALSFIAFVILCVVTLIKRRYF